MVRKRTLNRIAPLAVVDAKSVAVHLNAAFETGDPSVVIRAIGAAARGRGMSDVARQVRVGRSALYRSLDGGTEPEFSTVMRVLSVLGVRLVAKLK